MPNRRQRNRGHKLQPTVPHKRPTTPTTGASLSAGQRGQKWLVWIGLALTIIGAVIGVPSILPAISFVAGPYDVSSPLSTPFSVTNSGLLTIYAVNFVCKLNSVDSTMQQFSTLGLTTEHLISNRLEPRDTFDVVCPLHELFKGTGPIKSADIEIVVSFQPKFLPLTRLKCARFITDTNPEGRLRWLQRPSAHCEWPASILKRTYK